MLQMILNLHTAAVYSIGDWSISGFLNLPGLIIHLRHYHSLKYSPQFQAVVVSLYVQFLEKRGKSIEFLNNQSFIF